MLSTFFLTGCASGMGRHMTTVFLRQGHKVIATDINAEQLEQVATEEGWNPSQVRLFRLDVTNYNEWEDVFQKAVKEWGGIDVTINFAGLLLSSWATETPLKEIHSQIDVNLKGTIFGTQISARHMVERGSGHIINISSIAGVVPVPGLSIYSASKHAVRAYSLSVALELKKKGVYVTVICPATVQTPMLDNQLHVEAAELYFSGLRILTVKDIEKAIVKRALPKKPMEIFIPRFKVKLFQIVSLCPSLGRFISPIYQWAGRWRQNRRRKKN
ncbi:MAG TPA: SDR family oxidoreductase [Candidatus Hydrogenedens sp.]|nr:SDR family oxidoreductase [Candidatus Hydrogenedens sp.]HOK09398.1 SDR family oxidoreductase [Candidatus Hydrogenedens sp.]HOL19111.1 SDR family oxidoreductase [Candidatus Hydrogenedens sp.]HPP58071.1 SDR family oxidoreductase [Candidatus Hydrogenedens sp.]